MSHKIRAGLMGASILLGIGVIIGLRALLWTSERRSVEPAKLDRAPEEAASESVVLDTERASIVATNADTEAIAAAPQVPPKRPEEDYGDLVGIEFETNPRVVKARILRHQLRVYDAKPKHEFIRGDEFALMYSVIPVILDADPSHYVAGEVWHGHTFNSNDRQYRFEFGRFPEYDAWMQRQDDQQKNPKLYEVPLDPSVFRSLEANAKKALVLLESGE